MISLFDHLPSWTSGLGLVAHFGIGAVIGLIFFQTLWSIARLLVSGGGIIVTLLSTVGRFGLVGATLILASHDGATALLVTTAGLFAARYVVIDRIKVIA